jgi:phospholipase/carboxylesterase
MTRSSHSSESGDDLHQGQPIESAGAPPQAADAAVVMVHGRGATAQSFLSLIDEFLHHGVMYLAPQAARSTWYPRSGYAPMEANEPWFSSALARVKTALETATTAGIPSERVILLGFSQGAGIVSEYAARNPRRYGGLVALSGSLLGPETSHAYDGTIDGTPVFVGCARNDPYVPAERIHETASVFEQLDGDVTVEFYEELGHAITGDELQVVNAFVEQFD